MAFICLSWQHAHARSIGVIQKMSGDVLTLSSAGTKTYLSEGDVLSSKLVIITKKRSSLTIELQNYHLLTIDEGSRLSLFKSKKSNLVIATLNSGRLEYHNTSTSDSSFYVANKTRQQFYSSRHFSFELKDQKLTFNKIGNDKIVTLKSKTKEKVKQAIKTPNNSALSELDQVFGNSGATASAPVAAITYSGAQSELDDIFSTPSENSDVVTNTIEEVTVNGKKKRKSSYTLDLYLKSTLYATSPETGPGLGNVDAQSFHQDVRVSIGDKYILDDKSTISVGGWLETSNRKEIYNDIKFPQNIQSSKRDYVYVNELFYTHSEKKYDLQVGKKILKLGKGIIYSPTDSVSAVDVTVPTSPVLLGNYVISLDYYLGDWTLTTMLLPLVVPNKAATQNSRWTTFFSDINFDLKEEFPSGLNAKSKQVLVKLEGTKYDTDWMFTFFNGPNPNPVVRTDINVTDNVPNFTLVQEFVPITFLSAGFSTVLRGFEVHGELLMQNADEGKDDSFIAQMLGFRYVMDSVPKVLGLDSIDIIMEHGKETMKKAITAPFYNFSSISSRPYQNSVVGTIMFNISERTSLNYDFHFDLENSGSAQLYSYNYASPTLGKFRFKMETYQGERTSNFGLWDNNDNFTFEYSYSF
jgi:hypothetical protein